VSSAVTTSLINAVKIDTGANCYVHDFLVDGVFYMNNPSNTIGAAVNVLIGANSYAQNEIYRNIFGKNSNGMSIRFKQFETAPFVLIDGFALYNLKSTIAGIEVSDQTGANGNENIVIRNGVLHNSAALGAALPVGVMLTGGGVNQGASGTATIESITIWNFKNSISDNLLESGSTYTSGWTNIFINAILFSSPTVSMTGTWKITNSPGFNPVGKITNFISGSTFVPQGSSSSVVSGTVYVIDGVDMIWSCSGGTVTAIVEKDQAGTQVFSVANCAALPATFVNIPVGYSITFTHTGAPIVNVFGT
jgi:hypothetical protein